MRPTRPILSSTLAAALLLSSCGEGGVATGDQGVPTTAFSCPTKGTESFSKARFVLKVGLAAGAFHQWIWKPYQEGGFKEGADGRTANLVKAGLAAGFAAKQVKDAAENVKNDPELCSALGQPLAQLTGVLDGLQGSITRGDFSSLASAEALISSVLGKSEAEGVKIVEQVPESLR
jgi:hypothetical protein